MHKTLHWRDKTPATRFGEHRRSIQNHHQLIKPTPVSTHFNQPGHSIDHLLLLYSVGAHSQHA